jgi:hypothetical protein
MTNSFLLKPLFLGVLILFFHVNSQGQSKIDSLSKPVFIHGIGLGAGFSTGYGLSYRCMMQGKGIQLNFAPYSSADRAQHSIGLTLLYQLQQTKRTSLFLYQGNHFLYERYVSFEFNGQFSQEIDKSYMQWINGIGFGVEINIADNVGFNLMTGVAAYDNFSMLNLTGETALYYKF